MPQIAPDSLLSLEAYARERGAYRSRVIAHKRLRTVHAGEHVTLIFEDEQTIRYQVQEMLRIERIFEEAGIRGELEAYNPLIPDGSNWKATMLIEYPEPEERRRRLAELKGIEDRTWVQVEGCARVFAIADEDTERENDEKTSAVHFVRFELPPAARESLQRGARLTIGVDHPEYRTSVEPSAEQRQALIVDLR
jgi:TusA-related sulfurtransferase